MRVDLYSGLQDALSFQPSQRNTSGYIATQNNSSGSIATQNSSDSKPNNENMKVFILNSPGGYGKTFLFNVISAKIRREGGIVLNVANKGLAVQNLIGGRTAHSRFKIPIPVMEDSTCNVKAQSDLAKLLKKTNLIIWDEVFSCHRHNIEAVDRTLRDIMQSTELFGGLVVCLAGDPRQTLPIVRRGNRAAIVNACIQMSPLYSKMKKCFLTENMRTNVEEREFTEYLLRVGEGKEEVYEDLGEYTVKIPDEYLVDNTEHLINVTFPSLGSIEM